MRGHRDAPRSGRTALRSIREFLDETEDVIPAAAIQTGGVFAQLVENLVQFERRENRLDQARSP